MGDVDVELEEGEIADDSNDACSLNDDGAGGGNRDPNDGVPQKKRKKVMRRVKRKIKVKKKVMRKKGGGGGGSGGGGGGGGGGVNASDNNNSLMNVPTTSTNNQPVTLNQPQNSHQLDSIWEQQILMLQELQRQQADQQLTQILRAAATDEDLRMPISFHLKAPAASSVQFVPVSQAAPNLSHLQLLPQQQQLQQQVLQKQQLDQPNSHHQTPSSPDDENGKSSYEAITKMLTLLRNSANVSDSSSYLKDLDQLPHHMNQNLSDTHNLDSLARPKGNIEYSLVPIYVEGIDYTKYKLLSRFEPKFKNDPRLNQQA